MNLIFSRLTLGIALPIDFSTSLFDSSKASIKINIFLYLEIDFLLNPLNFLKSNLLYLV